jgi:glutaconate CoA-transferase, subunit A
MTDIVVPASRRRSKLQPLEEAAAVIRDGMTLAVGGIHSNNSPMALVREIVRQAPMQLRLVPNVSAGVPADLLIGAGLVATVVDCYIGLEDLGLARNFRRAVERGDLEVEEADEVYLIGGLMAGAADQPFYALPKGHGALSDAMLNPGFKTVRNPYTGDEAYLAPAIQPDVAIIHAAQADRFGNARLHGSVVGDYLLARASAHVIVSAEEIISPEEIVSEPQATTVPEFMVDAVVHSPYGAHPTSCHGVYLHDEPALIDYRDTPIDDYIAAYIRGSDEWAYLQSFGIRRLLELRQNPAWTVHGAELEGEKASLAG